MVVVVSLIKMPFKINLVSEEVDKVKQHFSSPSKTVNNKASGDLRREGTLEEDWLIYVLICYSLFSYCKQ